MGTAQRPRGRHSIRLQDFDYSLPGAYFITIPSRDRVPFLAVASGDAIILTKTGEIARACWREMPDHYPHVRLDAYVVMPDHLHGLLLIVGARHGVSQQ
jgi:REP element-mobilizing transposase RayT